MVLVERPVFFVVFQLAHGFPVNKNETRSTWPSQAKSADCSPSSLDGERHELAPAFERRQLRIGRARAAANPPGAGTLGARHLQSGLHLDGDFLATISSHVEQKPDKVQVKMDRGAAVSTLRGSNDTAKAVADQVEAHLVRGGPLQTLQQEVKASAFTELELALWAVSSWCSPVAIYARRTVTPDAVASQSTTDRSDRIEIAGACTPTRPPCASASRGCLQVSGACSLRRARWRPAAHALPDSRAELERVIRGVFPGGFWCDLCEGMGVVSVTGRPHERIGVGVKKVGAASLVKQRQRCCQSIGLRFVIAFALWTREMVARSPRR